MLKATNTKCNINEVRGILPYIIFDEKDRCAINYTNGNILYDDYVTHKQFINSPIDNLLKSIPYKIGEARLIKLKPGTCYWSHCDIDDRYHLNLTSNEHCYLIDLDKLIFHKLETDEILYEMDAGITHTAVNYGSTDRIQLVIRKPLSINNEIPLKTVRVHNPPYNFHYIFDNTISKFLNRCNKNKTLGYFKRTSQVEIQLRLEENALNEFVDLLNSIHKEYIIS